MHNGVSCQRLRFYWQSCEQGVLLPKLCLLDHRGLRLPLQCAFPECHVIVRPPTCHRGQFVLVRRLYLDPKEAADRSRSQGCRYGIASFCTFPRGPVRTCREFTNRDPPAPPNHATFPDHLRTRSRSADISVERRMLRPREIWREMSPRKKSQSPH
jgi:hypothetical protein